MKFNSIFKTANGEFEINRVIGALGSLSYVVGANLFVAWDVLVKGREFDVTAYCLAFPGGLGVAVGSIGVAVAVKDRGVATAKIITDTGAVPTAPPAGPSVEPSMVKS